jgi:hypothetical protein
LAGYSPMRKNPVGGHGRLGFFAERSKDGETRSLGGPIEELRQYRRPGSESKQGHNVGMLSRPACIGFPCHAGKEHRVVLLGRPGEVVRRCEYARMVVLCLGDRLGKILDCLAQRRQRRAVVEYDRLVKALLPALIRHRARNLSEGAVVRLASTHCKPGRARRPHHTCRRAGLPTADPGEPRKPSRCRRRAGKCVRVYRAPRVRERAPLPSLGSGPPSGLSRLDRDCRPNRKIGSPCRLQTRPRNSHSRECPQAHVE